jgi:asparagine synthase (glutamine-hydrolysing)
MAGELAPRGPDGEGIEIRENVGLVNRRLAIVDPGPAGAQPMYDPERAWLLSFNGEVYNHELLREELPGNTWRGHCDTETLCRALAAWGPAAIERCNGPLALAALDRRGRRLFLARDRLGKKPLYVARHRGALWFASEIRALLAAGLPASADVEVLAHAATSGWALGRRTPLRGVGRLGPGTILTLDLETLSSSERRWYDPAETVRPALADGLASRKRSDLVDLLEVELRSSVRRRLIADVPVGTLCSGGLDSSLVTAMARAEQPGIVAFSCSLPEEGRRRNEARWAERATGALDVELHTTEMTPAVFRAALVEAVRAHEYPLDGPHSVPISLMAGLARDRGVKVLLTGEGADELFGGYPPIYRSAMRRFLPRWLTLYREWSRPLAWGWPLLKSGWRDRRGSPPAGQISLDQAQSSVQHERTIMAEATRAYSHHSGARAELETALLAQLSLVPFPFLLNRMDKDAMARSVETRLPFLDPAVVDLAVNLPLEARTYPRLKGILRDVGRRHLPRAIAIRPKQAGMHFDARRRTEEAARPSFLRDGMLRELLGMPADRWERLIESSTPRVGFRLWTAEIWARLFVEGASLAAVEGELWEPGVG